jgi:type II secretory pathway pseudopilin PulG
MIVELIVALVMAGMVMSMVFYSWRYVSNHTIKQQRKTLFQAEADRIVRTLERELRRSPGVKPVGGDLVKNRVKLLLPGGVDTVDYNFEYGVFKKNDTAFWNDDGRARISRFDVEQEALSRDEDTLSTVTLLITIGFTDRFGDSALYPLKVRVERPVDWADGALGRGGGWFF